MNFEVDVQGLFLVRDISQAAFLPDFLSNSDILIDTKKQLQLLTHKNVQLQLAIISCSCNFNYRIWEIIAIPGPHFL